MATPAEMKLNDDLRLFRLSNSHGLRLSVTNFGARMVSLHVPDADGKLSDILLGYDAINQYPGGNPYFGAIIGRFGNRISKGRFTLHNVDYLLSVNNGENSLHGGPMGFHNVLWKESARTTSSIALHYLSKDGDEGYPGNLSVDILYSLTEQNELIVDYTASTDRSTIINLTSHGYFNLAGEGNGDILDHELMINANTFTPIDEGLIPTGKKQSVDGTPFDFRTPHRIGDRINDSNEQLRRGHGYDHNWILNKNDGAITLAARVREPLSGRVMEVLTTEPGMQFYSGNFLEGTGADIGKGGKPYAGRTAFCLEAQHFPDSPNQPDFPSVVLEPGNIYTQQTIYRFPAR